MQKPLQSYDIMHAVIYESKHIPRVKLYEVNTCLQLVT